MTKSIQNLYGQYLLSNGVFTDSRNPVKDGIFFALSGPTFDGNKFASQALELGARIVVIDDASLKTDDRHFLIPNTLRALQDLALLHRQNFKGSVIGLTGSNGKTTTKELIHDILSKKYHVTTTKGNLNNHIGVPLTILEISHESRLAVIEMGANHVGEIGALCEIAKPTHGLITNIGKAHLDGFGGFEGVIRGKSELYDYLLKNDGQAFINTKDKILQNMARRFEKKVSYPVGEFITVEHIGSNPYNVFSLDGRDEIQTHLIGDYNFSNIAAALCIGKYFNVPADICEKAVADYVPSMNRSQVLEKSTNTIILDAYNANPDSMKAALINLSTLEAAKKVVILGDMMELGEASESEHESLGLLVNSMHPNQTIFCGKSVLTSHHQVTGSQYFETKDELVRYLVLNPIFDSTVLIKASRGIGLETIVEEVF